MKEAITIAVCLVVWLLLFIVTLVGLHYAFASMGIDDPWGPASVLSILCSLVWAVAVARAGDEVLR